tara:strand:- start:5508 stop:6149 length:642 start_codon:yes stop_codon:yes gene_type:complete
MKKIISIIFLISLISISAHAESIEDIEIEGLSIGDSALKYFSKDLIEISSSNLPRTDNKYRYAAIYDSRFSEYDNSSKFKYKVYDVIEIYYLKNDKDYIIHGLAGALSKNFGKRFVSEKECIALKENIFDEIKPLYPDAKIIRRDNPAPVDPTGKSMAYRNALKINPNSKWFEVEIMCIFYKGKYTKDYESTAGVVVKTDKYNDWLNKQALMN